MLFVQLKYLVATNCWITCYICNLVLWRTILRKKNNTFTSVAPLQSGNYTIIIHGVVYYNTIVISAQSNYTFFADSAQQLLSVLGKLFRASVDSECLSLEASTSLNMMWIPVMQLMQQWRMHDTNQRTVCEGESATLCSVRSPHCVVAPLKELHCVWHSDCRGMWYYIVHKIRSHSTQYNNKWPVHYHQLYQSSPADLKWHATPCWEHLWAWIHQRPIEIQSTWSTDGNHAFCFAVDSASLSADIMRPDKRK